MIAALQAGLAAVLATFAAMAADVAMLGIVFEDHGIAIAAAAATFALFFAAIAVGAAGLKP